eukprot:669010-Lingulodinium_polyedra.AAC.2
MSSLGSSGIPCPPPWLKVKFPLPSKPSVGVFLNPWVGPGAVSAYSLCPIALNPGGVEGAFVPSVVSTQIRETNP